MRYAKWLFNDDINTALLWSYLIDSSKENENNTGR